MINLITAGITTYNFKSHVASDISIDQKYVPAANLKSQEYLNNINEWTIQNKMKHAAQSMQIQQRRSIQHSNQSKIHQKILHISTFDEFQSRRPNQCIQANPFLKH